MATNTQTNGQDLPIESFTQLSELVQKLVFFGVFTVVDQFREKQDFKWASYQIETYITQEAVSNHGGVKDLCDTVINGLSTARKAATSYDAEYKASYAQSLVEDVRSMYNAAEQENNPQPIDYGVVHEKLYLAQTTLYEAWIIEFADRPHQLSEFTIWLDTSFFFLAPLEGEFKKGRQLRELKVGYLPALERRQRNEDDEPWIMPRPVVEAIGRAVAHLQWVSAQAEVNPNGSDAKALLMPRLELAHAELKGVIDDELRHIVDMYTFVILHQLLPGFVRRFDIPDFFKLRVDSLVTILTAVDDFLKTNPVILADLGHLLGRLLDSLDDMLVAKDKLLSIWETLTAGTPLGQWWERLKEWYHALRRELARAYYALPNEFDDLRIGARALPGILALLQTQADREQATQAEVQAIIDQHKQAAQQYLDQNAALFEPPPIDAPPSTSPFTALPSGFIRKEHDSGAVTFFLPDGTVLRATSDRLGVTPELSAVVPDGSAVEALTVLPGNSVRLSDGREFGVRPSGSDSVADEVFESSEQGQVSVHGACRELLLEDGVIIRFYPAPDVVTASWSEGVMASISLVELRGLGTSGGFTEPEGAHLLFRSFRFDNGLTGTVDRGTGFTLVLPGGRTVKVKRSLASDGPGHDALMTQPFSCRRCVP